MSGDLTIRRCEAKDEAPFIKMNLDFMQETLKEEPYWTSIKMPSEEDMQRTFREALTKPDHILIIIAEIDGEAVGFANTWPVYSIWSQGMALTVDDLFIKAPFRRSGIGAKIMNYLEAFARKNGYARIQLHSGVHNIIAHSLYGKLGFAQEEMVYFMKKLDSASMEASKML